MIGTDIITGKLRAYSRYTWFERLWFPVAWLVLGWSRFAIVTMSFRRIAPWLGARELHPWVPLTDECAQARATRIGRIVRTAARHTPWESNCFPQAITARFLLGLHRIPCALFLGVARDKDGAQTMRAHAWVASGKVRVSGDYSFDRFTPVGCFVAGGADPRA